MSRSHYSDDCGAFELGRWRAAVNASIGGKRGQTMLREMLEAFDAMPVKELAAQSLVTDDGQFCALGALGNKRNMDMSELDPTEPEDVAHAFKIARALACEVVFENDECGPHEETPAQRWVRMRAWVVAKIVPVKP